MRSFLRNKLHSGRYFAQTESYSFNKYIFRHNRAKQRTEKTNSENEGYHRLVFAPSCKTNEEKKPRTYAVSYTILLYVNENVFKPFYLLAEFSTPRFPVSVHNEIYSRVYTIGDTHRAVLSNVSYVCSLLLDSYLIIYHWSETRCKDWSSACLLK